MHSLTECTILVNTRQMYTINQCTMYHQKTT